MTRSWALKAEKWSLLKGWACLLESWSLCLLPHHKLELGGDPCRAARLLQGKQSTAYTLQTCLHRELPGRAAAYKETWGLQRAMAPQQAYWGGSAWEGSILNYSQLTIFFPCILFSNLQHRNQQVQLIWITVIFLKSVKDLTVPGSRNLGFLLTSAGPNVINRCLAPGCHYF